MEILVVSLFDSWITHFESASSRYCGIMKIETNEGIYWDIHPEDAVIRGNTFIKRKVTTPNGTYSGIGINSVDGTAATIVSRGRSLQAMHRSNDLSQTKAFQLLIHFVSLRVLPSRR